MPRPESQERLARPAADNIRTIADLERQASREATSPERISDAVSRFVGSLSFVAWHLATLVAWIGWNAAAPTSWRFDPYPYSLLTFLVSLEAVLVSTFVLIAQNRMSRQSDRRDHLSLQISLLAEQEMTMVLRMLRRISEHLQVRPDTADAQQAEQLTESTNVYELMRTLKDELPPKN